MPRAKKFLDVLRPFTVIARTASQTQDLTRLPSLSSEEQKKQLRELVQRGDIITARFIACKLYGCSLAEAKAIVEGLLRGAQR